MTTDSNQPKPDNVPQPAMGETMGALPVTNSTEKKNDIIETPAFRGWRIPLTSKVPGLLSALACLLLAAVAIAAIMMSGQLSSILTKGYELVARLP